MAEEGIIRLLDVNTANQIAAGEVIEKPASVVKELIENSLDAGAKRIEVTVHAGGTEYIRVADDGCGMSEQDARISVLRHATSKIARAEDLMSLTTLGFRGEALPSIASVSRFHLITRTAHEEFATAVSIVGGENTEVSRTGGSVGTNVVVEDLFFNVPARRKFLKTIGTEGRYISELMTKLALSRPGVSFKLISNDREVLRTAGDGDLKACVRALYGKNVAQDLLDVYFSGPKVSVSGFIGRPTLLKGTRQWQHFFVNGRSVSSKMLAKAIDHAYQSQIPKTGFPFAVLNIKIDTSCVDVNVHPQKSEIKFSDDGLVYKAVFKALTDALLKPMSAKRQTELLADSDLMTFVGKNEVSPKPNTVKKTSYDDIIKKSGLDQIFKTPGALTDDNCEAQAAGNAAGVLTDSAIEPEEQDIFARNLKAAAGALPYGEPAEALSPVVEEPRQVAVAAGLPLQRPDTFSECSVAAVEAGKKESIAFADAGSGIDTIWPIGQVDKTFIIAQSEEALYLIDQHAAHERIIYDKLVAAHTSVPAQQLLIPIYVNLTKEEVAFFEEKAGEFLDLGIEGAAAGEAMLRISSLPADIRLNEAEDFIREIGTMLLEMRKVSGSDLRQEVLHMTACKAAIKAGQFLNLKQMRQLIIELCNTAHPFTCPHGRPCMIKIDRARFDKMFKRTGF